MVLKATPTKLIFYQENTQAIELFGLQDALTLAYLNAATLTATLVDDDGNQVPECIAVPLTYQPGTNGNYVGVFGDLNFLPPLGTGYTLIIEGNQQTSYIHLELLVEVQARQS